MSWQSDRKIFCPRIAEELAGRGLPEILAKIMARKRFAVPIDSAHFRIGRSFSNWIGSQVHTPVRFFRAVASMTRAHPAAKCPHPARVIGETGKAPPGYH